MIRNSFRTLTLLSILVWTQVSIGFSQNNALRAFGGVNAHTLLLEDNNIAGLRPFPKSSFGLSISREWPSKFFVEIGINYSRAHIYLEGDVTDFASEFGITVTNFGIAEADIYSQFFELPFYIGRRFYTGQKGHINIRTGGYLGYLSGQNTDIVIPIVISTPFFETTTEVALSDNSILVDKEWDVGVTLSFGYGYDITPNWRAGFDVRNQLSFVPISNELVPNQTARYISAKGLLSLTYVFSASKTE